MSELKCSECNGVLTLDLQGRVIPCEECMGAEHNEGVSEGMDQGWDEGHHHFQKEIFRDVYKRGYEDCYMALTKEHVSDWILRFAADDAQQDYNFED